MASLAASLFDRARRALGARDFEAAVRYAQEAKDLVCDEVQISNYDTPDEPTYSIIIVLYKRNEDLGEAVRRLSRYADKPEFELIFVNNGDFVAQDIRSKYCKKFRWIEVGFNYGCSGGRNLGAQMAGGAFLIFIDDDGLIEENAVEHLIDTISEHDAIAVRGRVYPKHQLRPWVLDYDLGDDVVYSVPNAEGISIWRRQEFLDHGGFDTLLAGGEGRALWSKIYQNQGPEGFLYTPRAVLLHDYVRSKRRSGSLNEAYFFFAYPDVERQRRELTLEFVRRAVELDPENATLHHHLGNLLQKWESLGEAEAAHRRAIELEPNLAWAHRQLSVLFARQDRQDEALAAARCAVGCDPEDARLHHHLGNLLQKRGSLDEAEAAHRRAIELEPNLAWAHRQLSVIRARQGREDEALAAARRAVECDPFNALLHHHLGNLLQEQGSLHEAEAAQRRAIELKQDV